MNVALILSGGNGSRIGGDIPKQYLTVENIPIISYSLKTLMNHPMIDSIQIVAHKEYRELIEEEIGKLSTEYNKGIFKGFSVPGENRQMSILNGLRDIRKYASDADTVLIHDAANQELLPDKILNVHGSTEPAILYGMDIVMIPGDENNFKITTIQDLEKFRRTV